jgi:beta-glucosidase
MTSYNLTNGIWNHYNYDLCTTVLRGEWDYCGNVMTDWWMQPSCDPDFPDLSNNAYRVRAQVDLLMPGGISFPNHNNDNTLLKSYEKPNGITLGEMQRSAKNVLNCIINSYSFSDNSKRSF